jgi:spore maturation protein B
MSAVGGGVLPLLFFVLGSVFLFGGEEYYKVFLHGAKEGGAAAVKLFPTMLLLVTAVTLFSASGAVKILSYALSGVCQMLHIPTELLPLLLTRPLSGSASMATLSELFDLYGADTYVGIAASVLAGASETLFYVMAVFCGGKRTRHILPAALLTMCFVTFLSLILTRIFLF